MTIYFKLIALLILMLSITCASWGNSATATSSDRFSQIEAVAQHYEAQKAEEHRIQAIKKRAEEEAKAYARKRKEAREDSLHNHEDQMRALDIEERKIDIEKQRKYLARQDEYIDRELKSQDADINVTNSTAGFISDVGAGVKGFLAPQQSPAGIQSATNAPLDTTQEN